MIYDLEKASGNLSLEADFCIVGAGTYGLFLARELAKKGHSVAVLEAGGLTPLARTLKKEKISVGSLNYAGVTRGQRFGLGGTSSVWGGNMLPMCQGDLEERDYLNSPESVIKYSELCHYYPQVDECLSLGGYFLESNRKTNIDDEGDFSIRRSRWIPFWKKNSFTRNQDFFRTSPLVNIWLNGEVSGGTTNQASQPTSGRKIESVLACSKNGPSIRVNAKQIILSSGVVNTTRFLFEVLRKEERFGDDGLKMLGKNFTDHISITIGEIKVAAKSAKLLSKQFLMSREKTFLSSPRFELTYKSQRDNSLPSAFFHLSVIDPKIVRIRDLFQQVRGISLKRPSSIARLLVSAVKLVPSALILGLGLVFSGRIIMAKGSRVILILDLEIPATEACSIVATVQKADQEDEMAINWTIPQDTIKHAQTATKLFADYWAGSFSHLGDMAMNPAVEFSDSNFEDVYHPTGALRAGGSNENSVVDKNLRVWGYENLSVLSTGVLHTSGSANPGYTMFALSLRLRDRLTRGLSE